MPHSHPGRRRLLGASVLIGLAAIGLVVAMTFWRTPRWNVVIVTLDTTRADRLGCYGHTKAETPVLDALAARGLLFEHAYAPIPLTLPSHASMFTGLYPPEHGIHTNGKSRLADGIPTLAEILQKNGYDTGAFVASFVLDSKFGLDRGFQTYGDDLTGTAPADEALHRARPGDRVVDEALDWLEARKENPFLCWVHLYDPHSPYEAHRDLFGDRFADNPYDAEIAFVDQQVGRLLKFLETRQLTERTLVLVVGDHGEGLGQHLERRHGSMVYNSTMHVPLIVSFPGQPAEARRIASPVSLVDIFPTVLEALGLSAPAARSGRSLQQTAAENSPARAVYGESDEPLLESGWAPLRSLTDSRWKYIRTARSELYDLTADPDETHNLAEEQRDQLERMEKELVDLEARMQKRQGADVRMTEEERRRIAGLGYAGGAGGTSQHGADLRDIKDMIAHYNALEDALELMGNGKLDEAVTSLKAINAAAPDYELAELCLGDAYLRQQKFEDATAIYQGVLKRNPSSALAHFHLGEVADAQGRIPEAAEHYAEAVRLDADSAKVYYNLGRTLILLGRDQDAIPQFEAALDLDPGFVFAHVQLGTVYARRGQFEQALKAYETALRYDANSTFAHMNAAMILSQLGRLDETLQHLEHAARISPKDPEIQFQLGAFLAGLKRTDDAITHLTEALRLKPDHAAASELLPKLKPGTTRPQP